MNEVQEVYTVCGACTNTCSLKVKMKNGKVDKLMGNENDPRTKGGICAKGIGSRQLLYDANRLKYPVKRAGERGENKWERISWEEALKEIGDRFNKIKEEHGPRAVGFYNGQASGWGFNYQMYQRLAHAFGTEPSWGTAECFAPRAIGQAMTYGSVPSYPDYENANMIVLWGRQPAFSSAPTTHLLFDAQQRGAKIVAIDPLRFHLGAKADQFIRIEPGTDLALALAVMYVIVENKLWDKDFVDKYTNDPGLERLSHHLFGGNTDGIHYTPEWASEITGIPANVIREFALELANTKGVSIMSGHGLEGRINVTQTARAVALIRLITGNIDNPGGDIITNECPKLNYEFTLNHLVNPGEKPKEYIRSMNVPDYNPPGNKSPLLFAMQGCISTPSAMDLIDEGKTKAGIIQACNPLLMFPNTKNVKQTLEKLDFIVVVDPYISETAKQVADIVLPAASFLERTEIEYVQYDRGFPYIRLRKKLDTFYEALPDWLIIAKLGQELGFKEYFPTEDIEYYTDLILKPSGITYKELAENPIIIHEEVKYKKYEESGFNLPGGKAHIYSEVFDEMGYEPLPRYYEGSENHRSTPEVGKDYPFVAFTGRPGPMYVHDQGRTLPWVRESRPEAFAMVNTLDAKDLNIEDGAWLSIKSLRGQIKIKAQVTNIVGKGCVYIPGGWKESNFNELSIDDKLCPISSQQNYTTCLVSIEEVREG